MKNVTIVVDEAMLRDVRRIAAERSTSLNALIREFLADLRERESRSVHARKRILKLCQESKAEVGRRTWNREDLHER